MTKSLAAELAPKGVRVNVICPGFIKTSYEKSFKKNLPEIHRMTIERTPMNRWGTAEEVASCVAFLLSDLSSYVADPRANRDLQIL